MVSWMSLYKEPWLGTASWLGEGLAEAVGLSEALLGQFSGLNAQPSVYVKLFYEIFILHYFHSNFLFTILYLDDALWKEHRYAVCRGVSGLVFGSNLVVAMETCIQNQCGRFNLKKERCLVKFVMPSLILHIFSFLSNNLDMNFTLAEHIDSSKSLFQQEKYFLL